jgi:hypothetical protein
MRIKAASLILLFFFAGFVGSRLAAEGEQDYPVSWERVDGAGGYRIELQNGRGETLVSKVVGKEALLYTFRLKPGSYRFRVRTLSAAMLDEGVTQWFLVVVEAPAAPQIAAIQPQELLTDRDQVVTITGKHFFKTIKAQLIDPSGAKSALQISKVSLTSMQILIPPLAQAGNYGILLANGDAFTTFKTKALRVSYEAPVFGSLAPAEIRLGVDQPSFSAQADKLAASAAVVVCSSGSDPSVAANCLPVTATIGSGRIDVNLDPATAAGDYDLFVINHLAETPARVGTVKLLPAPASAPPAAAAPEAIAEPVDASPAAVADADPVVAPLPNFQANGANLAPTQAKPAGQRFLAGLGWSYGLPLTQWGGIYGPTPECAFLRLDYFFSPFDRPSSGSSWNFALGLENRYAGFSNVKDSSLVRSSLASFSFALDPSATWSIRALSLRARLGGGLAYSSLKASPPAGGSANISDSFDLLAAGELGVEFPILPFARLGLAFDYERLFLTQGMDFLGLSTYAAFDF